MKPRTAALGDTALSEVTPLSPAMLLDEWDTSHPQADYGHANAGLDASFDHDEKAVDSSARLKVETPIFRLLKQEWEPSRDQGSILSVSVGNFMMIVATENCHVVRWNMKTEAIEDLILSRKPEDKIHKVFVDPTGNHSIVSCVNGLNFYINARSTKFLPLSKWKGVVVESVAWEKKNKSEASTKKFLIGSDHGSIYEAIIENDKEKHFNKVYDLIEDPDRRDEKVPISGLEFDLFPGSDSKFLIMVATPTRHHQFIGGPTIEAALATYTATPKTPAKALPKFIELPATLSYSSMQTFESESDSGEESGGASCAWLTGVGVFYANMVFGAQNPGDGVFSQSKLLPFPSEAVVSGGLAPALSGGGNGAEQDQGVAPRSLSLTEFHFLLLYKNRLLAINRLSEDVVWTLPVQPERIGYGSSSSSASGGSGLLGFARDATHQCIFAYSDRAVFEIGIDHEDRDVWRLYLEDGNFAAALERCHDAQQEESVREAEADSHFEKGQFEHAARLYAQTSRSFEEVALRFVQRKATDALRVFLMTRLERTDAKREVTQRVMLCTWLTELFLDQLNQLKDGGSGRGGSGGGGSGFGASGSGGGGASDEYEQCVADFRAFLIQYKQYLQLNRDTTFDLIASHGRIDELLFYAQLIGEHERVIQHHLQRGNHLAALRALQMLDGDEAGHDELFYKYSPILMHFVPERMVDCLMQVEFLDPCKLIPALMRCESQQQQKQLTSSSSAAASASAPVSTGASSAASAAAAAGGDSQAIRFLEHCVTQRKNADPAIHNYLLSLYAKVPGRAGEARLLRFIDAGGERPAFDLKYALRLCHQERKTRACVSIYTSMGLFEEAVKLALSPECDDLELAKRVAETPTADDDVPAAEKKKIWLLIARHIIEHQQDISKAIAVLKEFQKLRLSDDDGDGDGSEQLKIEDILPFFPDFVKIADFKDEICDSLDQYNAHIEKLKEEMDELTKNANLIRTDISQLRNRFGYVSAGQKCDFCMQAVLTRSFLIFPCSHVFHVDCVVAELDRQMNPGAAAARKRRALPASGSGGPLGGMSTGASDSLNNSAYSASASSSSSSSSSSSAAVSSSLGFSSFFGDESTRARTDGERREDQASVAAERERERAELERRRKVEEAAAGECLFCGEHMINSVTEPFIAPDELEEIESWVV